MHDMNFYEKGRLNVKEFTVCYTLDNEIKKRKKIIKGLDVNKEEIVQEVLERMERSQFLLWPIKKRGFNYRLLFSTLCTRYKKKKSVSSNII
ncbi:hypothetical protein GCM10020331_000860 [Ectobacillus funiculus]